jgi:hypothetical protein
VVPRPDGAKARCGGPGLCSTCTRELVAHRGGHDPRCTSLTPAPQLCDCRVWASIDGGKQPGESDADAIVRQAEDGTSYHARLTAVADAARALHAVLGSDEDPEWSALGDALEALDGERDV